MKVIGITGWSGAGKTTLISRLIPLLAMDGLRVSTVKHAHHDFDMDTPGKDSWIHRQAGATEVLVSSSQRWVLMGEINKDPEPALCQHLSKMSPVDLVLIEGYKTDPHPKIEVNRMSNGKPWLFPNDPAIVAIASDSPVDADGVIRLHIDDIASVAAVVRRNSISLSDFIANHSRRI
jgi:molybdopterin-guanine dinucleotide biosynthesis protein B